MHESNKEFVEYLDKVVWAENLLSPLSQLEVERRAREFLGLVEELSKYNGIKEFLRENPLNLDVGKRKMPLFLVLDTVDSSSEEIAVVYFESRYMSFRIDDIDKLKEKVGLLNSCYVTNILASISKEMLVEMIRSVAFKKRQDWPIQKDMNKHFIILFFDPIL